MKNNIEILINYVNFLICGILTNMADMEELRGANDSHMLN